MEKKKASFADILRFTGKLFLYQFITSVMTFFTFMGVTPIFGLGDVWQPILISGVPSVVILSMSYLEAWKYGSRVKGARGDGRGLVNLGALRLDATVGALLFELPSIIFYILFALGEGWAIFGIWALRFNFDVFFRLFEKGGEWVYIIPFLFLITPLLATIGFNLGCRDISITERLKYGKKEK